MNYFDCINQADDPDFLSTVSMHHQKIFFFQNKFGEAVSTEKKSVQSIITSPDVSSSIERLGLTHPQVTNWFSCTSEW
jgi:hypothetical protein